MSDCSRSPRDSRRRIAALAASTCAITGAAPLLLRHSGSSDWSDIVLGAIMGLGIGISIVLLIAAARTARTGS